MKRIGIATIAAAGLSAAVLGLATPAAATTMSGVKSAQETIMNLEDMGYRVLVKNPNDKPLDEATVVNVRRGNTVEGWTWDPTHDDIQKNVLYTNVFVEVR
jgi:hypothetical protein